MREKRSLERTRVYPVGTGGPMPPVPSPKL